MRHEKAKIAKLFARGAELEEKYKRLAELNAELNMDKRENEIVDGQRSRVRMSATRTAEQYLIVLTDNGQIARWK